MISQRGLVGSLAQQMKTRVSWPTTWKEAWSRAGRGAGVQDGSCSALAIPLFTQQASVSTQKGQVLGGGPKMRETPTLLSRSLGEKDAGK